MRLLLGRRRTLLVAPYKTGTQDIDFHLPSDLNGLTLVKYYPYFNPKDLPAKLGPVASEIKGIIEDEKELVDSRIEDILKTKALTGGLIYLLRHLNTRTYSTGYRGDRLVDIFRAFNKRLDYPIDPFTGWEKTTQYALQTLYALGLAENVGHYECSITPAGRALLENERIKKIFNSEMLMLLVP